MEDRDISRSASGSGARMSLSSRWQPEHLFLKSPAASTFWFCAGFLEQPGNEHTRTAKNKTLTCQRAMHTKQADLRSGIQSEFATRFGCSNACAICLGERHIQPHFPSQVKRCAPIRTVSYLFVNPEECLRNFTVYFNTLSFPRRTEREALGRV